MSKEQLRENAIEILCDSEKLKSVRHGIKQAEYHFGLIDNPDDFLNTLVWLGPVGEWGAFTPHANNMGKVYAQIAHKNEERSIGKVADRILCEFGGDSKCPAEALTTLYRKTGWFGSYLHMYARFDPRLVGPIWVRSIRDYEKDQPIYGGNSDSKLYIDDGNHRALTYALHLLSGDEYRGENFVPVPILWSESWNHILYWAEGRQTSTSDSPPKELQHFFEGAKENYFQHRF